MSKRDLEKPPEHTQPEAAGGKTSPTAVETARAKKALRDAAWKLACRCGVGHDNIPFIERELADYARATVEAQAAELKRARAILVESVLAIGGHAEERTSLDFLANLPEEIRLRVARLKQERDEVHATALKLMRDALTILAPQHEDAATPPSEVSRASSPSPKGGAR